MIGGASGNTPVPLPPDVFRSRTAAPDDNTRPQQPSDPADPRNAPRRGEQASEPERPRRATPPGEVETVRLRSMDQSVLSRRSQQAIATFEQVAASADTEATGGGELLGVDVRV